MLQSVKFLDTKFDIKEILLVGIWKKIYQPSPQLRLSMKES